MTDCEFTQLGGWGLALSRGPKGAHVSRCRFHDISGGAIYIGNANETRSNDLAVRPAFVSVADNDISNIGTEYQGSSGIHLFSAEDSTIRNNRLHHTPYTAVSFVWPVPWRDSYNSNLSLVSNDISDPSFWGTDG